MAVDYPCAVFRCDRGGCDRHVIDANPVYTDPVRLPDGWYRVDSSVADTKSWTLCSDPCLAQWATTHAAPF